MSINIPKTFKSVHHFSFPQVPVKQTHCGRNLNATFLSSVRTSSVRLIKTRSRPDCAIGERHSFLSSNRTRLKYQFLTLEIICSICIFTGGRQVNHFLFISSLTSFLSLTLRLKFWQETRPNVTADEGT